jgi:transposase
MVTSQVARIFEVSPAWARRIKQDRRETGRTTPRPMGGVRRVKIDPARLRQLVEQQPDATLKELRDRLGIVCAESAICMALKRLKLSFKKRRFMRPSRTGPTSRNSGPTGGSGSLRSTAGG